MARVVITGATSGIGQIAARLLIGRGDIVVAGARGDGAPEGCEVRSLDLASLASVRNFAAGIDGPIDALVLNAGMQRLDVAGLTVDGFEQTFATNHLAHYLLARLLVKQVADGGRVVLTSSGTHDPAEKTGVPAPRHADAAKLADPRTDPDVDARAQIAGLRAYASSKLCNLMTARTLAGSADVVARGIRVHAYDPGFIPTTGLSRNAPWVVRAAIMPALALVARVMPGMNVADDAGAALAGLADGRISGSQVYMALRHGKPTWPQPSPLARDDAACEKLWVDSARLVALHA